MPTGPHEGANHEMQGRLPRGHCNRPNAAFKCGDAFLEHRIGGVGDARIDVAGALHIEKRRRLISILKDK